MSNDVFVCLYVLIDLLLFVHGKKLGSCWNGQLTLTSLFLDRHNLNGSLLLSVQPYSATETN